MRYLLLAICNRLPCVGQARMVGLSAYLTAIALAFAALPAVGSVLSTGDVTPADNPFSPIDEGLPLMGNSILPFEPVDGQTFFEGRHDENDPANLTDDFNVNANVFVGSRSFGTLLISGESVLRYMNLVIGDRGTLADGSQRFGTGVVRITGFGSTYNNDFNILPPNLPANFSSVNPRAEAPAMNGLDGPDEGFDLYVGRYGSGTLEISAGGRAEIQDAVIVGDQPGSTGAIIVDGFDSFLGSGGLTSSGTDVIHQMVVGRLGSGSMTISMGGTVLSESTQNSATNFDTVGAVIGGDPAQNVSEEPESGGRGVVTVTGLNSKWIIGGSLQIGGFQERASGLGATDEGQGLQYSSEVGRGTLNVAEGGLVHIRPAINAVSDDDELRLLIGRFGRVQLSGGTIQIGSVTDAEDGVQDTVQLLNDGVILGSGRIDTGVFRNRYLGEVRVSAGEKLIVDAGSEFRGSLGSMDMAPLTNWGVIQVFGTKDAPAELEFERAPNTELDPLQPFFNLRVPRPGGAPPNDFFGGLISAQHSILRFRSSLVNEGMLAFTKGSNYVTGDVINLPAPLPQDRGVINVLGADVTAIFENDLLNGGVLNIQGGAVVEVLARHSFVNTGKLNIDLNPNNPTHLLIGGDAGISGELSVALSGFSPGSLEVGDTFEIISVAGELGGVDLSDPLRPRPDLDSFPLFTSVNIFPNLAFFGLPANAVMIPIYTPNSVLLAIQSVAGIIGADFNGDGVVDLADLAILQANIGLTMGATPLQGDADGDGDVDGDDFLQWQLQIGPVPASGFGSNASLNNVPEPASLGLVLAGLLALFATRRSRR